MNRTIQQDAPPALVMREVRDLLRLKMAMAHEGRSEFADEVALASIEAREMQLLEELNKFAGRIPASSGNGGPRRKEPRNPSKARGTRRSGSTSDVQKLQHELSSRLGSRLTILPGKPRNGGKIVIEYDSWDEAERILVNLPPAL